MRTIDVVYYTFQHMMTHTSGHGKPEGKLKKVKDQSWCNSSWDVFNFKPFDCVNGGLRLLDHAMYDDYQTLWQTSNRLGYTHLKYAKRILKRVQQFDAQGRYDYTHQGYKTERIRHKFRIIKVHYMLTEEIVEEENEHGKRSSR